MTGMSYPLSMLEIPAGTAAVSRRRGRRCRWLSASNARASSCDVKIQDVIWNFGLLCYFFWRKFVLVVCLVSKKKLGNEIIFCCFPNLKQDRQDGKTLYFWNFYVEENICWQLTSTLFGLIRKCSRLNLPKNTCSNNDLTEGDSLEIQNIPFLASLAFLLVFLPIEDGILFSVFLTNNILTWTKPTIIEQSMMISLKSIKCN